jgi:MSHA biogenesis protein MshP
MTAKAQRGFSIITAIFLIVVLAGLGVAIVSITGIQQSNQSLDIQGVRAYQAARAGVEWAAFQVLDPNLTGGTALAGCPASPPFSGLGGTLSPFTVNVACTVTQTTEGNRNIGVYRIVSTACNQAPCPNSTPGSGYVERQITATLSKCKDPSAPAPRFACG